MKHRSGHICLALLAWVLSMPMGLAQTFSAFVDRNEVPVGGTFQVSFKLENAQTREIEYPDFSGFQVLSGPNSSQSMQIIQGKVSQSLTYSFYLSPIKKGSYTIGPAKAVVQGKSYSTKPVKVTATAGGSAAGSTGQSGNTKSGGKNPELEKELQKSLFLRALVSKRKAYKGEQLTITYKLYQKVPITNASFDQQPQYDGFWTEKVDVASNTVKNEVYNDIQYQTRVLQQDIIFPQKSGSLTIKPMKISCLVRVRAPGRRRQRSIFDSFFDQYSEYEYTFGNQPIQIEVSELPPAPADFTGMVGDFKLNVSLDKTETETGEPVTYKVRLSGAGNIKKLPEPQLDFPPDFEVYDPTVNEQVSRNKGLLGGRRTYEYLVLPRNPGEFTLPALDISYFDPKQGAYKKLSSPSYTLSVTGEPQGGASASGRYGQEELSLIGEDIRYIRTENRRFRAPGQSFIGTGGFWALFALPFLLLAGLQWFQQKRQSEAMDVAGTRSKKANKVAVKRMAQAKQHLEAKQDKDFYDEVVRALWGYAGAKLTLNPSDLNRDNITQAMDKRGVAGDLSERLKGLIDTCEMALFAPGAISGGMEGTYEQAIKLITDLEAAFQKKPA